MLGLGVLEGAQRACRSLRFTQRFDVTILPALLVLGEGRRRVGSFDSAGVAE